LPQHSLLLFGQTKPIHIEFGKSTVKVEDLNDDDLVRFARDETPVILQQALHRMGSGEQRKRGLRRYMIGILNELVNLKKVRNLEETLDFCGNFLYFHVFISDFALLHFSMPLPCCFLGVSIYNEEF
ncbi:hypothetical protein ACJX0J_021883, partial [Zea mays]